MKTRELDSVMAEKMNELKKRIVQILEAKNASVNSVFTDKTMARKMYYQLDKPSTISAEMVGRILDRFPDVSADWIFRGIGNMIIQPRQSINTQDIVVGEGNQLAKDGGSINNGSTEINIDYKEKYLITKGELDKANALLGIYEPLAKGVLENLKQKNE